MTKSDMIIVSNILKQVYKHAEVCDDDNFISEVSIELTKLEEDNLLRITSNLVSEIYKLEEKE